MLKFRRNFIKIGAFWTTILVNVGMWLERFLIIVPGLARKQVFVYTWEGYWPSPVEWIIMAWSFAWVSFLMLLFARFFPLVPLFEAKESQVFTTEMKVGRATVPMVIRE